MPHRFRWAAPVVVTVLALALSACGGGSSATEVAAGSDGRVPLRVTSLGGALCEELGLFAKDGAFFDKNGIDVKFVGATGGNAGVAALQSGAADVVFITSAAALNAMAKGVDLTIVSGAVRTGPETNGVIVKAGSGIRGPRDLAGKKVGVLELSGMSTTTVKLWVDEATGGASGIKFVQLPFSELVPAVLNGTVDAAHVTAAEIYGLTKNRTGRSIGSPVYDVPGGSTPTGMYVAKSDFAAKNQGTMEKFVAAMQQAADAANDPKNTKRFDVMAGYCKKPAADLAQIPQPGRPTFEGYIDRDSFARIVKTVHEAQMIPSGFDPEKKVAAFAWATKN